MRIVIDMQGFQGTNRQRGIGRYTLSLVRSIVKNKGNNEIILVLNGSFVDSIEYIRATFNNIIPQENICVWGEIGSVDERRSENEIRRKISESTREAFIANLQPDVVLVSSLFEGFVDNTVTSIGTFCKSVPTVVILYDLIPLIYYKTYLDNPAVKSWYENKLEYLKQADLLLAISGSSCQEGIKYLNFSTDSCINISTAADEHFEPIAVRQEIKNEVCKRYGLNKPFLMYTGGIDHRKNIEGLIQAYAKLPETIRSEHKLAIICSVQPATKTELETLAVKNGLKSGELVLTGFVSDEDLLILYNICKAFVFPSCHEGFGLPALEAMSCGKAVIAANTSSLPEVIGLDEALFDPKNIPSMTEKIKQVLSDEQFRIRLEKHSLRQAKKFSWDESAKRAIKALETLNERKVSSLLTTGIKSLPRPRLAYVSPLPPERSGISDYSAELIPELSKYYDIDVIITQSSVSDTWINKNCKIRSIEWFKANSKCYDRVLYHLGNSEFHQHMFGLLEEIPGVVVLHDFFLSGVVAHMYANGYQPNYWGQMLYLSHGYQAVSDRYHAKDTADVVYKYPTNLPVLQSAKKVIVHSENSIHLAKQWYSGGIDQKFSVVPLLRKSVENIGRPETRKRLGFSQKDFVVCSFGILGSTKLNHRLLSAFLNSKLVKDPNCYLIFVGENNIGLYGDNLLSVIKKFKIKNRVKIIGWTKAEDFNSYLDAADVAVQLRTFSRGETSAAVLDCMNHGLPTIVNANGSMADLSKDAVLMITDDFTDAELIAAMEALYKDKQQRLDLSEKAKKIINKKHNPAICAKQYFEVIEGAYSNDSATLTSLINHIASLRGNALNELGLVELSTCLASDFQLKPYKKQLFLDISELVQRDSKTGVQRVVRSLLKELLNNIPEGYSVEPVYATIDKGYKYARHFTLQFLNCPESILNDDPVEFRVGDIFLGLDLQPHVVISHESFYCKLRNYGVSVHFLVYDLLPVNLSKAFFEGAEILYRSWLKVVLGSDGVICISKAVADEVLAYIKTNKIINNRSFSVDWFHLGADVDNSVPTYGLPENAGHVFSELKSRPTFLTVGTIEPRKGQTQILSAFELLWKQGTQVNLVIVGKQGWMVESLIESIRKHPKLNQRLFWLEGISDEYLEKVYSLSSCLIAASEGEGFGLPLIEASRYKIPIIARDIPVFKEVAGEHAYYFNGLKTEDLAMAVYNWLDLNSNGEAPKSTKMPWLTWRQSTKRLLEIILPRNDAPLAQKINKTNFVLKIESTQAVVNKNIYHSKFKTVVNRCMIVILRSGFNKPLRRVYYLLRLNKLKLLNSLIK